ncbi:hypothetical protein D6774_02940 [Candidatus Woesearchaeota archaeon]|jgi:transcriptional regulator with PAS, ATPase and Fis domain|nr:MAG: hypothetical protein D6774_02940 [Candidatus Woesearchaeota archaeon]
MSQHSLEEQIKPKLTKLLGVSIEELNENIAQRLKQSPLLDFDIDTSLTLKEAKKRYRVTYFRRLLRMTYGNISEAAKLAGIDRRSLHRFISETGIDVERIREEMIKPYELRKDEIAGLIEGELRQYEGIVHPQRLSEAYNKVYDVSSEIVDLLPEEHPTLKEAEERFEKAFINAVIKESSSLRDAAHKLDIAYETLLRKK